MDIVNMHDAKTHFSRLVSAAAEGETVVIARAGRPVAKLTRIDSGRAPQRLGFLAGTAQVPDDFDTLGATEIAEAYGSPAQLVL